MAIPYKIRAAVYEKFGGRCAYCGHKITWDAMQVDHIISKHRRGTDGIKNLNPACLFCNSSKNAHSVAEFRRHIRKEVNFTMRWISRVAKSGRFSPGFRIAERYGLIKITDKPVFFYFETLQKSKAKKKKKVTRAQKPKP